MHAIVHLDVPPADIYIRLEQVTSTRQRQQQALEAWLGRVPTRVDDNTYAMMPACRNQRNNARQLDTLNINRAI
jgi:hypothetical protein